MTNHYVRPLLICGLTLALANLWGCSSDPGHGLAGMAEGSEVALPAAATTAATAARSVQPGQGQPATGGPQSEAAEISDLYRPVAELVALRCEHGQATYQCGECRYETGMVKVDADLLAAGLVQTESLSPQRVSTPFELAGQIAFD